MAKAPAKNNHGLREINQRLDRLSLEVIELKVDLAVLVSREGDVQDKLLQIIKDIDQIMRLVRTLDSRLK